MSRAVALVFAFFLTAAAEGAPPNATLSHASGAPAGPGPGCGGSFTAARGDTLYSIARRCETSVTELLQENRLGQPPVLAVGQALAIPGFARAEPPKPPEAGAPPAHDLLPPRREGRPDRAAPLPPPPPPPPLPPPPPREAGNIYHFQAGDTLYSLARWARTSLAALRAANPDVDPRGIDVGDPIRLPPGAVWPEAMRARERGQPVMTVAPSRVPVPVPPVSVSQPEVLSAPRPHRAPHAAPPPRPMPHVAPPPRDDDDEDKPKPDDDETPGGMDDGGPQPDGMWF